MRVDNGKMKVVLGKMLSAKMTGELHKNSFLIVWILSGSSLEKFWI